MLFLFFCATEYEMNAQESSNQGPKQLFFKSFTSADGLPSQNTHNTFQDKYGFLWVSTDEGLTRYDGYEFKPYYDDPLSEIHLKGACGFYEDDQARLWVINGAGYIHYYDRPKDEFVAIQSPLQDGWMEPSAHTILENEDQELVFSSYGGIVKYDPISESIDHVAIEGVRSPESWPHAEKVRIGPMYIDRGETIWMGTRKFGFVKYDLQDDSTTFYRFDPLYNRELLDDWITDIVKVDSTTIMIADYANGLVLWDMKAEAVHEVIRINEYLNTDRDVSITDIHPIGDQRYWLATDGLGLLLFNKKTRQIEQHYLEEGIESHSVADSRVSHVSQDRNGTFWLGTNTLQQASSELYDFVDLTSNIENPVSLPDNDIYWMSRLNSGDIIISTASGACILDIETNNFSFPVSDQFIEDQSFGVSGGNENTAWIGQYSNLHQVDVPSGKILKSYARDIVVDDQKNILRRACRIIEDEQHNIWIIDHWGRLKFINPKTDFTTNVFELAQDQESGKFVNCLSILDDPNNKRVIVGMDYGLALVSYENQKVTRLELSYEGLDLSKATYSYLYRDLQGYIWIIIDGKTYKFDLENLSLTLLNLNEEYDIGSFRWIIEEPQHTYWLSSFKGIIRYDEQSATSSSYYSPNVGGNTFNDPSPVVSSGGKIYFSGYKGITILDPKVVRPDNKLPKVLISALTVNKEPVMLDEDFSERRSIQLRYNFNDLVFSLTNFSFVNQLNSQYKYRLSPRDDEWIDNGNDHTLELFNLPPGDHLLELKASNSDGIWSDVITQMEIIITPPWWKTLWAKTLFLLLGIGTTLYVQWYLYKQKLNKQKDIETLRSKISSDLHDDVGTVLTGIAMQSELLENFADDQSKDIAGQIASRSREAMSKLRDTVWAMDSRKDSIGDLKDRMLDFIEDTLISKDILFALNSDLDHKMKIMPNVRQAIYLIFKESIINIIKHSDTRTVRISLSSKKEKIHLVIQDEGSEVERVKTSGLGLSNMRRRSEELGGTYSFDFDKGYITKVTIPFS